MSATPSHVPTWLAILYQPHPTIRGIVDSGRRRAGFLWAAAAGIGPTLERTPWLELDGPSAVALAIVTGVLQGSLVGLVTLFVAAWLFRWTGRPLGGKGSAGDIRMAIAWSTIPLTAAYALLLLFQLALLLALADPAHWTDGQIAATTIGREGINLVAIAFFVLAGWSVVLLLECLAEVQHFASVWALANLVLVILVLLAVGILLVIMDWLLHPGTFGS